MPLHLTVQRLLVITIIALFSLTIAGAQSGRKSPRSAPLPPVPMPTPETTAVAKEKEKAKPALTVVVGFERMNYYGNAAMVDEGAALRALVDRLNHAGVEVADTKRNMTRSDALRAARGEKEAFVIYVEISLDQMDGDLRMSYWVYSPQTAKIKASGRTYPQAYRNSGVILNPRSTVYGTRQMEEAARDVAERILRAFQLHLPGERSVT